MKTQILSFSLVALIATSGLSGCSSQAARINPGYLDVSEHSILHSAKIINIVQLSEKEAPKGKVIGGIIAGTVIGSILAKDESDSTQEDVAGLGGLIGGYIQKKKYGKTIYRLTLALDDKSVKEVYVRGGHYIVGKPVKITLNKTSGEVNSFKAS